MRTLLSVRRAVPALAAVLLTLAPAQAHAQRAEPARFAIRAAAAMEEIVLPQVSPPVLVQEADTSLEGIGSLVGMLGYLAGATAGATFGGGACGADCRGSAAFLGGAAGAALLIPYGIHVSNERRGSIWPSLALSIAAAAAGVGLASLADTDGMLVLGALAVAPVQVTVSAAVERATSKGGARR